MEVNGTFYFNDWWPCKGTSTFYTCQITKEEIPQRQITKINGTHKPNNNMESVIGVRFDDCKMTSIPTGFSKLFKNMKILLIFNSEITKVTKEDFADFPAITQLWIANCNIEYLPGNLLELMPKLEVFSVQTCKVKYIDPEIFDNHPHLKVIKLNGNANIDTFYIDDSMPSTTLSLSFDELKEELTSTKLKPPCDYETYDRLPKKLSGAIKSMLGNDDFKDVTITVDGAVFKAHGFVLVARSPAFAFMLKNGKEIALEGIKKEIFSEILKYFYTDEFPCVKVDMVDLIKAAEVLKLEELKRFGLQFLDVLNVTQDNALDMMSFGIEIGSKKLQDNAFDEIKKLLPEKKLKEEWVDNVAKVKEILDAKAQLDEEIKKAHEKFDQLFI